MNLELGRGGDMLESETTMPYLHPPSRCSHRVA
jgi:hypothetical protein